MEESVLAPEQRLNCARNAFLFFVAKRALCRAFESYPIL